MKHFIQELKKSFGLLQRLVALSLVDVETAPDFNNFYQISPLVAEWLQAQGIEPPSLALRKIAVEHQQMIFKHLKTISQAIVVHEALQLAELPDEANRFALGKIAPYFNRIGMYRTLLDKWLLPMRESADDSLQDRVLSWLGTTYQRLGDYDQALDYLQQSLKIQREIGDKSGEGTTLNNLSTLCHARGDYDQALDYLQQSLKIQREIGDAAGLCATLFNMGHIYWTKNDEKQAYVYWVNAYEIATKIGEYETLAALEDTAKQLGAEGLAFWALKQINYKDCI